MPSSPDLASIELRSAFRSPSPAPTYRTTDRVSSWSPPPHHRTQSNNPYHSPASIWEDDKKPIPKHSTSPSIQPNPTGSFRPTTPHHTGKTKITRRSPSPSFSIKPDPRDSSHPHYAAPSSPLPPTLPPPLHHRPHKRHLSKYLKLLPALLAFTFLLTTLYLASLLVGAKFLSILHPPPAIDLNLYINVNETGTPTVVVSTTTPTPTKEADDNTGRPVHMGLGSVSGRVTASATVVSGVASGRGAAGTPAPAPTAGVVDPISRSTLVTSTVSKR